MCLIFNLLTFSVNRYKDETVVPPSYTVIDGNFVSLFEYRENNDTPYFTLTSVANTPLDQYELSIDAENRMKNIKQEEISEKRLIFEGEVSHFVKNFTELYGTLQFEIKPVILTMLEYVGFFTSCKTKLVSGSANRECVQYKTARTMSLFGGKITGIFHAEEFVFNWLNEKIGHVRIHLPIHHSLLLQSLKYPVLSKMRESSVLITNVGGNAISKQLENQHSFGCKYDIEQLREFPATIFDKVVCSISSLISTYKFFFVFNLYSRFPVDLKEEFIMIQKLKSKLWSIHCRKFILISTTEVYSGLQGTLNEDTKIPAENSKRTEVSNRRYSQYVSAN